MPTQSMGSKKYTDALLQSMDALAKISVESSKAKTLTLEAKIAEVVDEGIGKYKVQYLDNIFYAYAANSSIVYEKEDIVYIIVPEGNFDKKITILSEVSSEISKLAVTEGDLYVPLGDSLFGATLGQDLCSRRVENNEITGNKSFFAKTFTEYLKDNRTFNLSCNIRTDIDANRRSNGNYGLILNIPVVDLNEVPSNYEVILDINNIMGNAYNFNVKALQNLYFTVPDDLSFNMDNLSDLTLTAFVKDFPGQDPVDEQGQYIGERIVDIWISEIGVYPTKVVSRNEKEGYFLKARATEGSLFWGGSSPSKELYPDLYLGGKPTSADSFDCYWFKENYRIGVRTKGWSQYGGVGWQILNKEERINETETGDGNYRYVPQQRYNISIGEIHSDLRYKCVLVKGDTILSDIITIRNLVDPAEFTIESESGSTVFTKGVPNSKAILVVKYWDSDLSNDSSLQYEFTRFNQYGKTIDDKNPDGKSYKEGIFALESKVPNEKIVDESNGKTYLVTKFSLPVKEIYNFNTIYCTAYKSQVNTAGDEVSSEVVATTSITLSTAKAPSFTVVLENADKVYKYDIDGDSPMVANYDGPSSSKITAITPITARAYKVDGSEFDENEYNISTITWKIPKNSMIQFEPKDKDAMRIMQLSEDSTGQYYIISGSYPQFKNLYYSIATTFSRNKSDNVIRVNIKMQDLSIDGLATIKFLKDGESGTAGSKFAAIIAHGPTSKEAKSYEEIEYVEVTDPQTGGISTVERIHKIQLICVDVEGSPVKWYLYNSATDEYRKFTRGFDSPDWVQFWVQMYCDGEPLEQSGMNFDITWDIFDHDNPYTNVVSPIEINSATGIINIKYEDERDPSKGLIKWPKVESTDAIPKVCGATIVASCQAKKSSQDNSENNNAMFEKRIRAYYPIEVTYSRSMEIINQKLIPRLDGGFYQVVYDSEGSNPSYNSNQNFVFEDRLTAEASDLNSGDSQAYIWSSSESIIIEDVHDPQDSEIILPLEKKITPTARRFPDSNGCQYVKVEYGYDVDPRAIEGELEVLYEEQAGVICDRAFYYNFENAKTIIGEFQTIYGNIKSLITFNDNLLLLKQQLQDFFVRLQDQTLQLSANYDDILSNDGKAYLNHVKDVYNTLLNTSQHIGEKNYTLQEIHDIFMDYGAPVNCQLDGGHWKGIYIDQNYNFYTPSASRNRKEIFRNALIEFRTYINQFYEGGGQGYYYIIFDDNPDSDFSIAFDIFRSTQDQLNGYYEDRKMTNPEIYSESGDYTYTDIFTQELVSRWEVLIKNFVHIYVKKEGNEYIFVDDDDNYDYEFIIENPYYDIFNPIYENLGIIITNMKETKFKSYSDVMTVLDAIYNQLSLYFNFTLFDLITEYEDKVYNITKEITGLEQLIDNYGISNLIHVKPIVILLNPTATWLDWDGNKLKIDDEGNYIAAPIFAAGKYETSGNFTGLTMGVQREEVDRTKQRVGLLGHYNGQQSLFIDAETGKAEFGLVETGQIKIDPQAESLRIYDSLYESDSSEGGMCINFAQRHIGTQAVSSSIHFKNASGIIYSGKHESQDSKEDGFYLSHDGFSIGANVDIKRNGTFTFGNKGTNKYIDWDGNNFVIGDGVQVTASRINANSTITCGDTAFKVEGTNGDLSAGNGNFTVSGTGNVNIAGNVNIGTSGSGNININGVLRARANSWIGNWQVTPEGKLYGYNSKNDATYGSEYDLATLKLDPSNSLIGFYTGASLNNDPKKHDFVYIGCNTDDDEDTQSYKNTLLVYRNGNPGSLGKLKAGALISSNCAMRTNWVYIGCRGSSCEGVDQNSHPIRIGISSEGTPLIQIATYSKKNKKWDWTTKINLSKANIT